jgi:hypothetical protein
MNKGTYDVKSVKTFRGTDDEGYNAVLTREGKPVAEAVYDGGGGEVNLYWLDYEVRPRVEVQWTSYDGQPMVIACTPEEARLYEQIRGQTFVCEYFPDNPSPMSPDVFIGSLVEDFLNDKRFKRLCKTQTLFRLQGDPTGVYRTCKHVYDEAMKAHLRQKHGTTIVEILNEKYTAAG